MSTEDLTKESHLSVSFLALKSQGLASVLFTFWNLHTAQDLPSEDVWEDTATAVANTFKHFGQMRIHRKDKKILQQ